MAPTVTIDPVAVEGPRVSSYRIIYRVSPDTGDSVTTGDIRILAVPGPGAAVTIVSPGLANLPTR